MLITGQVEFITSGCYLAPSELESVQMLNGKPLRFDKTALLERESLKEKIYGRKSGVNRGSE
jgi:hypothetical protein